MKERYCENCGNLFHIANTHKRNWCSIGCGKILNKEKEEKVVENQKSYSYVEIYARSKGISVKRAEKEINDKSHPAYLF